MIIGYELTGYDNDSYMTGSCEKLFEIPEIPKCKKCGYRLDYKFTNKSFKLKRKTLDISETYDGITIVSLKFKEFCIRNKYTNLTFIDLPNAPNFYQLYIVGNTLKYEAILKEKFCEECQQYESVVGPSLNKENITKPLNDGFYQSDLWFASGNEKSPTIIISSETLKKLKIEKIKGICSNKIEI